MQNLASALNERHQQHLYRTRQILQTPQAARVSIEGKEYLSFCSNDYLGLANHPEVISAFKEGLERFGAGSGAAHLISGHSYAHQVLEEALAEFTGRPRALLFSTGYMANLGVIDALTDPKSAVLEDRLNHASLLDGARLSGAKLLRYRHRDNTSLQSRLAQSDAIETRLIATDAVFSMDGDCADLKGLYKQAKQTNSWLLVDDAHGFGVLGPQGRGWCVDQLGDEAEHTVLMATLGKACGTFGAFVAASEDLIETLIQSARTFIYTTAPPPAQAWATHRALQILRDEQPRREQLEDLVGYFRSCAGQIGLPLMASATPIQPVLVKDASRALLMSEALREKQLLVTAIRPPTVPAGAARLRITFSATHSRSDVDRLLEALADCLQDSDYDPGC